MDLGSTHGTCVDGIKIEAMELVSLRDCNTIEIGPYQLTFHLQRGRPRADRRVTSPVAVPVGPPAVSLWKTTLARSEAIRRVRSEHGPSDLLRRAAEVIELVAEMIVLFRRPATGSRSMLRSSKTDEIAAYLLSPSGGEHALRELRDMLTELFIALATTGVTS
jgi:pSer/pThr/pTyr-binding forkhead associated (FHA) protein